MKNLLILNALFCFTTVAQAWETSAKVNVQQASTNNVNLTNTDPSSDSYSILNGYVQTKDDTYKLKLKARTEKYKTHTENDNYTFDLSLQYKRSKTNDYTLALFKQVYNGVPLVTTDTSSDNSGARLSTTFSKEFDKDTLGYLGLNGTYRQYSKIDQRTDKTFDGSLGLEHYYTPDFSVSPELFVGANTSTDAYYQNTFYGASFLVSYVPTESWEFFVDGSYSHTNYSDRTVSTTVRNRSASEEEYQNLASAGIGATYTIANIIPIQARYSTSTNSSNNSTSAYKAEVISLSIGFNF